MLFIKFFTGKEIYGAAAKNSVAKMLRGNTVTAVASIAIMSAGDVINIFRGRISGAQLFKNVLNTSANVGGGIAGWGTGAAIGSAILPGVGTFIGGFIGAFTAGSAAGKVSQTITDELIEDDSKEMLRILEKEFNGVATDYLLNKSVGEKVADRLKEKLDGGNKLKDMYASINRYSFARNLLESCAEPVVRSRKKIYLPSTESYVQGLKKVLEKDSQESNDSKELYEVAINCYHKGDFSNAINLFTQVIESNQNNKEAYRYRGYCYRKIGRHDKADFDLKKSGEI